MDSNMNKKERIEEEVRKTLDVFELKESLPPNPYLYTRIQKRIKEKMENNSKILVILKPVLLTILLLINVGTVIWYFNSSEDYYVTETRQELIEILSSDLNLKTNQSNIFLSE